MRTPQLILTVLLVGSSCMATAQSNGPRERRQHAAAAFHDGILLLHAGSRLDLEADGFRQDPFFFYFTGLENTVGALLAIDGESRESWLFLPSQPPYLKAGLQPEARPGLESAKRLGIEHVVDWAGLYGFLDSNARRARPLYYVSDPIEFDELPLNLLSPKSPNAPMWLQMIVRQWPAYEPTAATARIQALMQIQSSVEVAALRSAAKATVSALMAGMRATRPGVSQRAVEIAVEHSCWTAGAHGSSFWPWAMSGEHGVFPRPLYLDGPVRSP